MRFHTISNCIIVDSFNHISLTLSNSKNLMCLMFYKALNGQRKFECELSEIRNFQFSVACFALIFRQHEYYPNGKA